MQIIKFALMESPSGLYPLGVNYKNKSQDMKSELKNCYQARVFYKDKRKQIGVFPTPILAHKAWQKEKSLIIRSYADEEKDEDIINSLISIAEKIEQDIINNRITKILRLGENS